MLTGAASCVSRREKSLPSNNGIPRVSKKPGAAALGLADEPVLLGRFNAEEAEAMGAIYDPAAPGRASVDPI